jgi:hypothetical protein
MNMTRRAFFMHPARPVGEDLANAGEWLRRAGQKGKGPLPGGGGTTAENEQMSAPAAHGIGLRNARANMRSNTNE